MKEKELKLLLTEQATIKLKRYLVLLAIIVRKQLKKLLYLLAVMLKKKEILLINTENLIHL